MEKLRKMSFFQTNLLFTILNLLILGVVISVICYYLHINFMKKQLTQQTEGLASLWTSVLSANDVKAANHEFRLESPVQKNVMAQLSQLSDYNKNVAQGYIFAPELKEGKLQWISIPNHNLEYGIKPGDIYGDDPVWVHAFEQVLKTKKPVNMDLYEDQFGVWMTSIAPIQDQTGNIVGILGVDVSASDIQHSKAEMIKYLLLAFFSVIAIILIVLYFSMKKLLAPLQQLFTSIQKVSEGDLSVTLQVNSQNELGQLAGHFNNMISTIRSTVFDISKWARHITESSSTMQQNTSQTSEAASRINASIREMATDIDRQTKSMQESAQAMEEMSIGIQRIVESSTSVSEKSYHTVHVADRGNLLIGDAVQQMTHIHETVSGLSHTIKNLDGNTKQINSIIQVITDIAAKTNLLALNAAIEAARAGEHGKGFAVVAGEVRKLAEQSKDSASQIVSLIHAISKDTDQSVQAMQTGMNEVEKGIELFHTVGEAFKEILFAAKEVEVHLQEVSAVSEEMSASSQQITASVFEVKSLAEGSAINSQRVAASSEEQLASMNQVASASVGLLDVSENLEAAVSKFKL